MEEELLKSIDKICEDYSKANKFKYTRSQFVTDACLFLIGSAQAEYSKNIQEENNMKEEEN